ncbi:MAG: LuxR C-terminal-related transcriptional regulator [Sphaerochaetaceae bacterium]|nr:LuxR C-terminal-related transcriptional regulator [Sphaerochaetaceae bacterium]
MSEYFIPAPNAYRKMELAMARNSSVYIYGATGFGKTRLATEFLKGKDPLVFSAFEEFDMSKVKDPQSEGMQYIIFDDLQQLHDDYRKDLIVELARRKDIMLVLCGRMPTPSYLISLIAEGHLVIVTEDDLKLTSKELIQILDKEGVKLSAEDIEISVRMSDGNAYLLATLVHRSKNERKQGAELRHEIYEIFVSHLMTNVIPQWSKSLQEFLMQISVVDEFTLPLAVMISGDNQAASMLEIASQAGNFISLTDGVYRIRESLVVALRNMALKILGLQRYNQCCQNAGLYYETNGDILNALKMYGQSGNTVNIRSLLIRNGQRHFGDGLFYGLRRYYLSLQEDDIASSPTLMFAMSMLYSVQMNPERSEYWYAKLKEHAKSAKGDDKREANGFLLYLDIALPHRGNADVLDGFQRGVSQITTGGISLPEFSVTDNLPSIINGAKDLSSWCKNDKAIVESLGMSLETIFGNYGRGLAHVGLGESLYEKGGNDNEFIHNAMLAQMEVEGGGRLEILFACIGILIRYNLLSGNVRNSLQMLDALEKRVREEKANQLLANIEALRCRIMLMKGDRTYVDKWLEGAPDEMTDFWTLERYRYMTKVLCYIQSGENYNALNLIEKLRYYSQVNKRPYFHMETGLLLAIVNRNEAREWKKEFVETLQEIQECGFMRIISEKGAGILPLLKEAKKEYLELEGADSSWFNAVLKETGTVAERYPGYLVCESAQLSDFSETSLMVLRMQSNGYCVKEIAQALKISERTVKYHCAENYRKLGAKGKTDAVQIARKLNIL